ncbi:hypothetical protein Ana3638_06060 [Anaerocolumna sedimenticola]|uniref:Uncharacterized protein n=1 Tax=Anaerocolumna sedimenticola TaxID=2696063 RepID=A0A6P1TK05_9FIRM|nr:hypothetical protein [Anaerocolumna sedimenticola]QHQ60391.1 hypothetical protein Ana3638_06060 [Anaerocolumna sedimenticola]
MNCYDEFYNQSQEATRILSESNYAELMKEAVEHRYICHGNYTYHNVIMLKANQISSVNWNSYKNEEALSAAGLRGTIKANMATTNFDRACVGIQITDIYQFIRKVMEKNDWDPDIGSMILDNYNRILPIDKDELKLLYVLLLYPEKFWKITNFYYNGKKSWVPQRNIQKLIGIQEQMDRKKQFLDCLAATLT